MNTIMCKRDFYHLKKGNCYEYWTNFGGLNHIVKYEENNVYPFDGQMIQIMIMGIVVVNGFLITFILWKK